ncbi:MAG: sugar transferase [Clostridia bacterium]|nr:sugar transferase [Clostridia bacterium]
MYQKYIKRFFDIVCAISAIVAFCWLYAIVAVLVRLNLGSPVVFKQPRPGKIDPATGREKIFNMYKFRTMTDARDVNGELLPDSMRITKLGKALRATSLDELPEAFNILKGDMSVIGPRPQLVRDMVFMSEEQRRRHIVRPGLSGLAQVNGRNSITWQEKLDTDLVYIEKITFWGDFKIVCRTVKQVFIRKNMTETSSETDLAEDFGDALLESGKISAEEYEEKQELAKEILAGA